MPGNPLTLIAEVTHRCPLHCVYCSNPLQLAATSVELSTEEWTSVFQQSGKLGMLHAHFTGGEPLARTDIAQLIGAAREAGPIPTSSPRASALASLGCRRSSTPGSTTFKSVFKIHAKSRQAGSRERKRTRTRSNCRVPQAP